jgi:uncharacterized Zn finger protein
MSIQIDRFEDDVHFLITERGKEYYDAHQIRALTQTAEGWTATIEGNEEYHVLLVGHDVITHWQCTCPFEHGPVCKHVAAVLYAVRDAIRVNRASASGELDRLIDEADIDTLKRLMKMSVRMHDGVRSTVYHEMKHEN